jgi:uncharacterized protein (TIGR02145 family)/uncharacterized repeat protein (TIGR02543 family)
MSCSIWYKSLSVLMIASLFFIFFSCFEQPISPYQASNAKIYLTVRSAMLQSFVGSYTDSVGDSINIGITTNFPQFVDSIGLKVCTQTGLVEGGTIFKNISTSQGNDTLWYKMLFKTLGEKSIIAQAYISQNNNYCDTIQINVVTMSAPVITVNPTDQATCIGSPDSFSVSAAGPGTLKYQWKNVAGNLTGPHFIGVTTNKFIIDSVLISDTGTYSCLVTNAMDSTVSSSAAKLTINMNTVKFSANGGSPVDSQNIFCNTTATAPTLPKKTGYTFSGWYSDSTLATAYSFSTPITAMTTLYAKWILNTYTISFNCNGGSTISNQAIAYDSAAILPTPAPTKAGYSFAGWYSDSTLSSAFSFSTLTTASITLFAKWALNTNTVNFNSNGGSAVSAQTIGYNTTATQPSAPTRTGYSFAGWYSDSLLTTAFNFSVPVITAITLYAKWTLNTYAVSFNSNGGSSISAQTIAYNAFAIQPSAPTKTGNTFAGWYSDSALATAYGFSTPVTAAITLFAKWTVNLYTVSFNSNGGSAAISQMIAFNSTATQPSPTPTQSGYGLLGWYSDSLLTAAFSFSTPVTSSITLYAKWTANLYIVTFNSNGGSSVPNQTVVYNSVATQPTSPIRTGYILSGWYLDSVLTSVFNFSTPITASITLYAKWTINTYTVNFNSNGGSTVASQTIPFNSLSVVPSPAPTMAGNSFSGWYSDSTLTNAFNFSTPITAAITLYAKWTINTYTVSFNSNGGSVVTNQTVAYNSTATLPTPAPTKTGYSLVGWYSDSLLTNAFNFTAPITAAITFYAKWTKNTFTVSFNSKGGSVIANQTVAYNSTATQPIAPTKTGSTFAYWCSDSLLTNQYNFTTLIVASITLYAKWTINTYTVSFNSNGGSAVANQTVSYGAQAMAPVAPAKTKDSFIRWYSDSIFTTPFSFSTPVIAPITLYAKWALLYDFDGNVYDTVTIGTQVWMVENLKTTRYNDGTAIPIVTDPGTWGGLLTPGYCWFNNDSANYGNTYGALYNWYAVNTGKLPPAGWHVASVLEWAVLTAFLGGDGVAGGPLKEADTAHWSTPNIGATNTSGFSALPGGIRASTGAFLSFGNDGTWWSSTANGATISYDWYIGYNSVSISLENDGNTYGCSVRCVRD